MNAPYYLAVDVGTSRTSAAVARYAPDATLTATTVALGRNTDNAPTVVFVADGELLFGDAAERRGTTQPDRLIREFKRRIGDDVPILAGDRAFAAEELYALTVDWAARIVTEREGASPARLAITVPAAWGRYRGETVRTALEVNGWRDVEVITEPEAAARHYEATNPLAPGRTLAVYDFGGGTFDAVLLRKDDSGEVGIVGSPVGAADLGGADFDDAVVRHIVAAAHVDPTTLAGGPTGRLALAALRRECVEAKESLSFDSEVVVPVLVDGDHRTVRLTRDEFEHMIDDDLERTVAILEGAVENAAVSLDDVEAILLTGGSSRIPRVAQLLSERFDRPIAIDADPKAIIALGAARAAGEAVAATAEASDDTSDLDIADAESRDLIVQGAAHGAGSGGSDRKRSWFRRLPATAYLAGGFAILLTATGIAAAPALSGGSSNPTTNVAASDALRLDLFDSPLTARQQPRLESFVVDAAAQQESPAAEAQPQQRSEQSATPRRTPRPSASPKATDRRATSRPNSPSAPATATSPGGSSGGSGDVSSTPAGTSGTASNSTPETPPTPSSDPVDTTPTTPPLPEPQPDPEPEPSTPPAPEPTNPPAETEPSPPPAEPEPEPSAPTTSSPSDPPVGEPVA